MAHGFVAEISIDAKGNETTKGEILNFYYYDAFGNVVDISEAVDNPYRYVGYQYDS